MRRLLPLALTAILAATATPAMAQGGGAEAPGPGAPASGGPSGGAAFSKPAPERRARRAPARQRAAVRRRPRGGAAIPRTPPRRTPKGHVFPIRGPYVFGGEDGRFGAPRAGGRRTHQGQDLAAAEGTAIVAPHAGTVEVVRYQGSGAGHYVVLDGDGEDRDYVFMHLRAGSIVVVEGQRVRTGARIGEVGNTGVSFGAHLHFEIWVGGGWYSGGHPIDPLPLLRSWAAK